MGDGDRGLRPATTGCQTPVLRRQIGALGAGCAVRRLNQAGSQPGASLPGGPTAALASAFVIAWSQPSPGGQLLCRGEAGEIGADLGDQRLADGPLNFGVWQLTEERTADLTLHNQYVIDD
jgi:hypothetical protein